MRRTAILLVLLAACGASAQQKALHATYLGVKAAEAGFDEWDKRHQEELVAKAPSLAAGVESLNSYRSARDPVLQAFMVVYQLLYVAAADTNDARLSAAIDAAKQLYHLIETLKKPAPSPATTQRQRPRRGIEHVTQARRAPSPVISYLEVTP